MVAAAASHDKVEETPCGRTSPGTGWVGDQRVLLPGQPEDLAVAHGVDVGELGQLLEVWAHQDLHLTHVWLLHLEEQQSSQSLTQAGGTS